jgi:hypothetical protein
MKHKLQPKKRKVGKPAALPETVEAVNSSSSPQDDLSRLPAHLFGLLPKANGTVSLKPLGKTKIANEGALYNVAYRVLCSVWDKQLVLKHMKNVDCHIYDKERSYNSEAIRNRCITRGAVLQSITDAFGDGIFCSTGMMAFLRRPCAMFNPALQRDSHFARAVERDDAATLQVFDDYLGNMCLLFPDLKDQCDRMAELVHRGLLSVNTGFTLSDSEYDDPAQLFSQGHSLTRLAKSTGTSKRKQSRHVVDLHPTLEKLLPQKAQFGIVAIIMREALARKRGHSATPKTTIFR